MAALPRGRWKTAVPATPEWERFQEALKARGMTMVGAARLSGVKRERIWAILHRTGGYRRSEDVKAAIAAAVGRQAGEIWLEGEDGGDGPDPPRAGVPARPAA